MIIPPLRFSAKQQPRLGRSIRMRQYRGLPTPEERARIMQLQHLSNKERRRQPVKRNALRLWR